MIRLREITLSRGGRPLLERTSAAIDLGERIALVGPNGSGKSTLLAALCGDVPLDAGDIEVPALRTMKLEQTAPSDPGAAWQVVLHADTALMQAAAALGGDIAFAGVASTDGASAHALDGAAPADAPADAHGDRPRDGALADAHDGMAIALAHDRFLEAGGASAPSRVRELLAGLGFAESQMDAPAASLSGGWRMRLSLARALFVPSDLLLLDEPTNHLDLDAIVWLERWLVRYPGTVVVVSHDRDFLDRIATATLAIEDRRLVRYAGGYSECERLRAERLAQQQRQAAAQAQRVAQLQSFIDRFRAKATKARQVQSRLKALERLERVAPLHASRGITFDLPDPGDSPDPLMLAERLDAGYGEHRVLAGVSLTIARGARLGVLGRNGAGKSTLVRTLVGELEPLAGECRRARSLRIGYFAQQGVEALRDDESPLAMLRRLWPDEREARLRAELGHVGFSGDDALRPIGPMSGGEKARLLLATLLRTRPHLLVLDEPTNHLDADARDALTDALAGFEGALVLVSHDRYLMRATVDRLLLVHDARVEPFDGDLDDDLAWLQDPPGASRARPAPAAGASGPTATPSRPSPAPGSDASQPGAQASTHAREARVDRREERRLAAERRRRLAERLEPLKRRLHDTEHQLHATESRLAQLEAELADPLLYRDPPRATELARERAALTRRREALEDDWLHGSEERERIEREFDAPR